MKRMKTKDEIFLREHNDLCSAGTLLQGIKVLVAAFCTLLYAYSLLAIRGSADRNLGTPTRMIYLLSMIQGVLDLPRDQPRPAARPVKIPDQRNG
jgi:hypothetical protein